MKKKQIVTIVVCLVLMMSVLTGCGGSSTKKKMSAKDYAGFYTLNWKGDYNIAMLITKSGDVCYMNERSGSHRGTLEIEDGEALIYLSAMYDRGGETNSSYSKYCPLKLKLTDSGNGGFLSSEHSDWIPDTFTVVDQKTFNRFIDEESRRVENMVTWDGKQWKTHEDRNK